MLVRLQTADHKRLASPVEKAQGPPAPGDRTWIVRFPMGKQIEAVALCFPHHRQRIFSALLLHPLASKQHLDNLRRNDFTKKSSHNQVICSPGGLFRLEF